MSKAFETVDSNLFTIANRPIAVSSDTSFINNIRVPPTTGWVPTATNTTIAQSALGKKWTFSYSSYNSASKMQLKNCSLQLGLLFRGNNGAGNLPAANAYPSWNIVGYLIRALNVSINGTSIVNISNYYSRCFTSHMLTAYDSAALDAHPALLHPVCLDADTYADGTGAGNGSAAARHTNYCTIAGKQYIVNIPFWDLCCCQNAGDAVYQNIRKLDIVIDFESATEATYGYRLMGVAVGSDTAGCLITGAELLIDSPTITATQQLSTVAGKTQGHGDENLAFYVPTCYNYQVNTNTQTIIPSVKYLRAVHMFQIAAQDSLGGDIAVANTSGNVGQLCFLKNASAALTFAESIGAGVPGVQTAQITWGNLIYPTSPLILYDGSGATFAARNSAYVLEYLKSTHRLCDRVDGLPASILGYMNTMQSLYICPWTEMAHNDQMSGDLIIRLTNTTTATTSTYNIVIWRLQAFAIKSDDANSVSGLLNA